MSNDSFQKKFKDQIQIMGKGGITSIQSTQPIQPYPNNMNNYYMPQNQQNMINMNYQNMNYGNQNFNPQQQFMNYNFNNNMMNYNFNNNMMNNNFNNNMMNKNINNNIKNNKKKNNDFSGWADIYNQEVKNNKNNKNIPKINSRIKSGGEMIMASNKNQQVNDKVKKPKKNKATTPQPQNNNVNMNQYNQFQMNPINLMNPQMMMNNPNFNPYAQYQQMMMNNNFNNNFNQIQMNNNYNNNFNNNNNLNNNNENSKNTNSNINNKNIQYVEYKPYTLKDYKELTRSKVVMGPLGANIGTKEWEEKKAKMKRMETYSNRINQTHKGINKLKKDTPQEEIEKNLKLKMENSHRYRTYEYGKLIRSARNYDSNSKISAITGNNDNYYKDLGVINENEEYRIKTGDIKNFNTHSNSNNNFDLNEDNNNFMISNENPNRFDYTFKKNISNFENEEINNNNINNTINNNINNNNNVPSLQSLIEQNENYKAKIADIKDSLL